jgi:hypothetical protein
MAIDQSYYDGRRRCCRLERARSQEMKRFSGVWFTDAETSDGGVIRLSRPDRTDRSEMGGSMAEMPSPCVY